jgi:hypothetical protein
MSVRDCTSDADAVGASLGDYDEKMLQSSILLLMVLFIDTSPNSVTNRRTKNIFTLHYH